MERRRIAGIGGWLILPMIGLIITPIRLGYMLITIHLQVFLSGAWGVLTSPGTEAYHPLWAPVLLFELAGNTLMMSWAAALLILLFAKSPRFPRWIILFYATSVAIVALDLVASRMIPAVAAQEDPSSAQELVRSVVAALIWIPYFLKSERVRNTFCRVPAAPEEAPSGPGEAIAPPEPTPAMERVD